MSQPAPPRSRGAGTRWDIQGLRAFAVAAVVLYHLWPSRLPGGFVGVDVFFVISGFLITGHLLREQQTSGRIALGAFWARRAKRLLPGAFLAILAVGATVLAVVPSTLWGQYGRELIASATYFENWQLASDSVDYLAAGNQPSPFQHFWSLSTEEQFYLALPVLLVVLALLTKRVRAASPAATARVLLGAAFAVSLAWCIIETRTAPGIAYFSTATRAWEFAAGGLIAAIPFRAARSAAGRGARTGLAALGVAGLAASLWVITPTTAFPGVAALLPVASAALVIAFGGGTLWESAGAFRPVAFLGRISYAVYLWHWPLIVLVPIVTAHPLTTVEKLAIAAASLAIAAASTLLLEEPLRFSRPMASMRPLRVGLLGAVATVAVVGLGVSTLGALHVQQDRAAALQHAVTHGEVDCFGAAAVIGSAHPCVDPKLASSRVPAPAAAANDDANRPGCWSNSTAAFNVCTLGPRTGYTKRFAAIGDSHNNVLIAAYAKLAAENNWRIDVAGHIGCYLTTAVQQAPSQTYTDDCNRWKQSALAWIRANPDLDALIVTHSDVMSPVIVPAGSTDQKTVVDGLVGAWSAATAEGVPVIAIRDNPAARDDVLTCLGRMQGPTTPACDSPRATALGAFDGSQQAVQRVGADAALIDLTEYYCTDTTCPAVIGGAVVYRDRTHLTATFAATLAPYLGAEIAKAAAGFASAR